MGNYIGFLPLSDITPTALQTIAGFIQPLAANIVCRYEDNAITDQLYSILGPDHPGYIHTVKGISNSYQRVAQSCDILFIYWDGHNKENRQTTDIIEKPFQTYIVLPSGTITHFNEGYKDNTFSATKLEHYLYRTDIEEDELILDGQKWDGLFSGKYFFLSSLATIGVPIDDGCIYPSLLHALVASSIENEIYRDFFMSSRIIYAADIFAWLKDFGIEINNNLFHSRELIQTLIANRYIYNKEYFDRYKLEVELIRSKQSYPLDTVIADILRENVGV